MVAQRCTKLPILGRLAVLAVVVALPATGVLHHQCDDDRSEDGGHGHTFVADASGGTDEQHTPDDPAARCAGSSCTSVPVPSLRQVASPDVPEQQAAAATDPLVSALETPEPPVPRQLLRA
jgi:hypothetical protein